MRRLAIILAFVVLCLAGTAQAVCSDGTDELCIVFGDYLSCENCVQVIPGTILEAYFVLYNPSAAGGVLGYDFDLCNEGGTLFAPPPSILVLGYTFPGGIIPIIPPLPFIIGFPTPLPWAPTVALVTMRLLVVGQDCWCFGVQPSPGGGFPNEMIYIDGDDPGNCIEMHPCTGPDWDQCSMACINCASCPPGPPISAQGSSWGSLKALYR